MPETTLHFDSPSEADAVILPSSGFPRRMEEAFGLAMTARDAWVKLVAETDEAAQRALGFLGFLRAARSAGLDLRGPTRFYLLERYLAGQEAALHDMIALRVDVMGGKRPVFPKTLGQASYLSAIREHDITFGVGPAGTGKTYLAMAMAVRALLDSQVNRIILTRPAVEAGEALGFLPGDLQQKIQPYLRPLYDALHDMMDAGTIEQFLDRGVIEVAPLAYMRGRTLNNSFIVLDEAQNTSEEQMLMFLTRIGYDSKCVVTGDPSQVDLPENRRSGLRESLLTLAEVRGISIHRLDEQDVVRHALVQRIIRAYNESRSQRHG